MSRPPIFGVQHGTFWLNSAAAQQVPTAGRQATRLSGQRPRDWMFE